MNVESLNKNTKKAGKTIKIDIRDLLSGDEENNQPHKFNGFKPKEDYNVYKKYKRPTPVESKNPKTLFEDNKYWMIFLIKNLKYLKAKILKF